MKHYSKKDINEMNRIYRLNLINSCTGYKSALFQEILIKIL